MEQDSKTNPHTTFIALSGKKQVGKDSSANICKKHLEKLGHSVAITAFAEPLKYIAINVLGIPREWVYGSDTDKNRLTYIMWDTLPKDSRERYALPSMMPQLLRSGPMTVREVLQVLGTDIFRNMLENDVWANAPFRRDWSGYDVVILTDCRFPNELKAVEDHGGTVIRLTRNTPFEDNHPSETALDDVEFKTQYDNNGSLEELEGFLLEVLNKHALGD